jgi:hypothetical protein
MKKTDVTSVKDYLASLPDEKRKEISRVRAVIRKHLPKGYVEGFGWGGITYHVPLKTYPNTYNKQPLCYAALAAQKNFNTLYLMGPYGDKGQRKTLEEAFKKAGLKLDMGKSCVHFKTAGDLPLDAIGGLIAAIPADKWIAHYEASRRK